MVVARTSWLGEKPDQGPPSGVKLQPAVGVPLLKPAVLLIQKPCAQAWYFAALASAPLDLQMPPNCTQSLLRLQPMLDKLMHEP